MDGVSFGDKVMEKLNALKDRPEVNGVLVNISDDPQVNDARYRSDANPSCVYAKNVLAQEIKDIVAVYPSTDYIVLLGNDDAIPFFRYPDPAQLDKESGYWPPVDDSSFSQASLQQDYILGQDAYGTTTEILAQNSTLPIPNKPVGRLVETAKDIDTYLGLYLGYTTNSVTQPHSALLTSYGPLNDGSMAVQTALNENLSGSDSLLIDTLFEPEWTANDLRASCKAVAMI